jgi:hypothetical protein
MISALGLACGPAQSRSLSVTGTAGYLSEWQINAALSDANAEHPGTLSGPVVMRHAGICAVSGPVEKSGEMRVAVSGWGAFSRIDVSMSLAGAQCLFRGSLAAVTRGVMDCSDAKGVPVELSIK